jgi:hypothetical protein
LFDFVDRKASEKHSVLPLFATPLQARTASFCRLADFVGNDAKAADVILPAVAAAVPHLFGKYQNNISDDSLSDVDLAKLLYGFSPSVSRQNYFLGDLKNPVNLVLENTSF